MADTMEDGDTLSSLGCGDGPPGLSKRPSQLLRAARSSGGLQSRNSSTEPELRRQRSRQFSRTSVDTDSIRLRQPRAAENDDEDEHPQWHSASLMFVALPAFAGMFFENGSAVMTDILMLGLGCLFLYWSVKWPWQWYYATQQLKLADIDPDQEYAVVEESDEDIPQNANQNDEDGSNIVRPEDVDAPGHYAVKTRVKRGEAVKSLQTLEIMALSSCFLSPGAVAYMLHAIRPYLSRPSGGLVSNSNLTLFVLAAELRPVLHFFRLVEERTLHLQRVVNSLPSNGDNNLQDRVDGLTRRLNEMSTLTFAQSSKVSDAATNDKRDPPSSEIIERNVRQALQPQLDALTRAVRRYEKRVTTQSIVTEARLQDLEVRLKDALSLAAAASRNSETTSLFSLFKNIITAPIEVVKSIALLPFQVSGELWRFLFGPRRVRSTRRGAGGSSVSKYAADFKGKGRLEAR